MEERSQALAVRQRVNGSDLGGGEEAPGDLVVVQSGTHLFDVNSHLSFTGNCEQGKAV